MTKVSPIQTNFTAGELSPRLEGRIDLAKYHNGCRILENMVIHPHGGASRRSGSRHVALAKDAEAPTRLVPFEFSTFQAYVLEFGPGSLRFYRNEARIETAPGEAYEIETPYGADELFALQYAQSADVMYITHPAHAPRKLSRTGHTSWVLAEIPFRDGPYEEIDSSGVTLSASAVSGTITLTASAGIFSPADEGRLMRLESGTPPIWGHVRITGHVSPSEAIAEVLSPLGASGPAIRWRRGAWCGAGSYPSCVAFFEERLVFAGSHAKPQTIWTSVSGDFESFAPSDVSGLLSDDKAITVTIATDQVNAIRWLSPGQVLAIGTSGGEFTLQSGSGQAPIAPTTIQVHRQTTRGCADTLPVRTDSVVLFLQRARRKIHEFVFAFETDGYQAPDLTLLAEHVSRGGIVQMAYAREPDSILWAVRQDGTLLGLTYQRSQDVVGWHRHTLGGACQGGPARVESLCVIPSPLGDHDQLWLVVARTVNGVVQRSIEFLEEAFDEETPLHEAFFMDAGLSYEGAATLTLSGLEHLEGETVCILADGAVHPDRVVESGSVALEWAASRIHVGLGYTSRLQTQRVEVGTREGTAQGKPVRIHEVTIRLWNTLGAKVGFDNDLSVIPFRSSADPMGVAPALFSGDRAVRFHKGFTTAPRVSAVQDQPLPMTVLGLLPRLAVFDG